MRTFYILFFTLCSLPLKSFAQTNEPQNKELPQRPNIFIAISDDQSFPHASAYGSKMVNTPSFDQIAREGALFTNAFCASPGCSPSRAALLTGMNTWQLEHAGTHASYFHPKYVTFPDQLEQNGYFVGHCGKGWGPGDFAKLGRKRNPAGKNFTQGGRKKGHYVSSFRAFLAERTDDQPFCFWFGSHDPHRSYEPGSGLKKGKTLEQAEVPGYLPDHKIVRSDLLDYAFEVERFDDDLGQMLEILKENGLDNNTLVIVTSDNGMPFPRAKANCYEPGIHVPLAIRPPTVNPNGNQAQQPKPRTVDDLVGFTDLTATIYDLAGIEPPSADDSSIRLAGKSLRNLLKSDRSGKLDPSRKAVYSARERHSSSRYNSLGYPQRCIRTERFLLIRNFRPARWPAGPNQKYQQAKYDETGNLVESLSRLEPTGNAFHDIDACPTLTLLAKTNEPEIDHYLKLSVARRPAIELFDISVDPDCTKDLATHEDFAATRDTLLNQLNDYLRTTGDRRVTAADTGDVWESYPRVSSLRWFPEPEWVKESARQIPDQDWIEKRRPRTNSDGE